MRKLGSVRSGKLAQTARLISWGGGAANTVLQVKPAAGCLTFYKTMVTFIQKEGGQHKGRERGVSLPLRRKSLSEK